MKKFKKVVLALLVMVILLGTISYGASIEETL